MPQDNPHNKTFLIVPRLSVSLNDSFCYYALERLDLYHRTTHSTACRETVEFRASTVDQRRPLLTVAGLRGESAAVSGSKKIMKK